ncbi:MAG: hypothetical protein HN999_02320 [Candidatus Marinimicrobia bacterium]|jgi:hypothetical protein|nr:hypothetical protein [Candidatus Neomarinimicrobiota bacterium]MBT4452981.1 hypothetical protein [Candidatus Neomarinimicrobiota bacterium]MBT4736159.1 hypothetical protein [Candidatus Neomarinimicrobiota bacterium]MBT5385666.1 hypothetical protein [Candidatus Neomarinimicrobiota bacterium]MBT6942024.1 hypothetical protein [Candidatus Neomarinimicrobiota bacterium]
MKQQNICCTTIRNEKTGTKEDSSPFYTVKTLGTKQMRVVGTGKNYSIFLKLPVMPITELDGM